MKKIVAILLIIVFALCLVACEVSGEVSGEVNEPNKPNIKTVSEAKIRIWTDAETGVQYIIYTDQAGYGGMGGITPRLNADGTLYIESEGEP